MNDTVQPITSETEIIEGSLQDIKARGLLSKIADMFFKGLDSLLGAAAEYQEEMGVLKQVTEVDLYDAKTDRDTGKFLRIKISPVRDKPEWYYFETETDYPGLDVSGLNDKVLKLNKSNKHALENKIEQLLEGTGLVMHIPTDQSGSPSQEQPSNVTSDDLTGKQLDQIEDMIDNIMDDLDQHPIAVNTKAGSVDTIIIAPVKNTDLVNIQFNIAVLGDSSIPKEKFTVSSVDGKGKVISEDELWNRIYNEVKRYMKANKLTEIDRSKVTTLSATLLKNKKGEVSLTAINASTEIKDPIQIIYAIVEDNDFVNSLPVEEEVSFAITDEGDDYNVECIEAVDTDSTYFVLFDAVSCLLSKLQTFKWAIGYDIWINQIQWNSLSYSLDDMLLQLSKWVIEHTDRYPTPICGLIAHPTLDEFKVNDKLSLELMNNNIDSDLSDLMMLFDCYYVNLEPNEQVTLSEMTSKLKETKTFLTVLTD